MDSDRVPLLHDLLHYFSGSFVAAADQEKGCLHIVLLQNLKDLRRQLGGTVVERQINDLVAWLRPDFFSLWHIKVREFFLKGKVLRRGNGGSRGTGNHTGLGGSQTV